MELESAVKVILVLGVAFFSLKNSWVENPKELFLVQYLVVISSFGLYLFMRNYFNGCENCAIDFDGVGIFYYALELLFYSAITFSIMLLFIRGKEPRRITLVKNHIQSTTHVKSEDFFKGHTKSIELDLEIENIKKIYQSNINTEQGALICKYAREHSISTSNEENKPLKELLISGQMKISVIEKCFSSYKDNKQQTKNFEEYLISVLADNTQIENIVSEEQLIQPVEPITKSEEPVLEEQIPEIEPAIVSEKANPNAPIDTNKKITWIIISATILFLIFYKLAYAVAGRTGHYVYNSYGQPLERIDTTSAFALNDTWWVWIIYVLVIAWLQNKIWSAHTELTLKSILPDFSKTFKNISSTEKIKVNPTVPNHNSKSDTATVEFKNEISFSELSKKVNLIIVTNSKRKDISEATLKFQTQLFEYISLGARGYFGDTEMKLKKDSILEALTINSILLKQVIRHYKSAYMLTVVDDCNLELLNELYNGDLNCYNLPERVELYTAEIGKYLNGRSTYVPNLLLYHLYTNPHTRQNNYQGNWSGTTKEYLNFLKTSSTVAKDLDEKVKKYFTTS